PAAQWEARSQRRPQGAADAESPLSASALHRVQRDGRGGLTALLLPSPPALWGRGVGGEGAFTFRALHTPLTPNPGSQDRGEGRKKERPTQWIGPTSTSSRRRPAPQSTPASSSFGTTLPSREWRTR